MGTRGAFGFLKDKDFKVAYNHNDSSPEGLGQSVLDFIHAHTVDEMKTMCDGIEMIDDSSTPTPEQIEKCKAAGTVNLGVNRQSETDWYCLLREAQGDLEKTCEVGFMPDDRLFLHESLFCEFAYIINLDDGVLEVYEGFQKSKPLGRFSHVESNDGYYGVGLVVTFELDKCPQKGSDLVPGEDDEE